MYPDLKGHQGKVGAIATGVAGLVGGALIGAGLAGAKKVAAEPEKRRPTAFPPIGTATTSTTPPRT
ncbi:MAG: hypothetical protein ACP5VN_05845 [Acidobacteriota bacterium]